MKKMVIDNYKPFFPEEIMINILKRLRAKSLIRFQCVSKRWKNIINNTSFIADHLHHSTHQNPCLLFQPYSCIRPLNLHLLDSEMQVRQVPSHASIDYFVVGCVVGSSNGLLCIDIGILSISQHMLLLCNPTIREVRQVPTTNTGCYGSLGFGFNPIVNDYKIVKFYVDMMGHGRPEKVEVYSLKTGSWKQVELGILEGASIDSASFTANGDIFWFGLKLDEEDEIDSLAGGNDNDVIISFDIVMEVFRFIPMPTAAPRSHLNRLTTYENKLAMLAYCGIGNSESSLIDLWVMEEGVVASGEKCSWTKKYTSNPYPCFVLPMTIWKNEIVCCISTGGEMENDKPNTVLFNLTTKEFTELTVSKSRFGHHIFNHVESLIQVGGMRLSTMFV